VREGAGQPSFGEMSLPWDCDSEHPNLGRRAASSPSSSGCFHLPEVHTLPSRNSIPIVPWGSTYPHCQLMHSRRVNTLTCEKVPCLSPISQWFAQHGMWPHWATRVPQGFSWSYLRRSFSLRVAKQ
jgi:hypothetical protein